MGLETLQRLQLVAVPRPVNKGHRKNKKNCYGKFLEEGSVSVTRLNFSHHHRKKNQSAIC